MHIGILGGTFNPVHKGHLAMADTAYRELGLDKVLLMPTGCPPHKNDITDPKDRLNMISLAINGYPYMEASDYEIRRNGTTYTADTLTLLTEEHPENSYTFIVGADSLVYMKKWYKPDIIFSHASIAVCARSDTDNDLLLKEKNILEDMYNADITILEFDLVNISSQEIRNAIKEGKTVSDTDCLKLVPEKVLDYIYEHRLYKYLL